MGTAVHPSLLALLVCSLSWVVSCEPSSPSSRGATAPSKTASLAAGPATAPVASAQPAMAGEAPSSSEVAASAAAYALARCPRRQSCRFGGLVTALRPDVAEVGTPQQRIAGLTLSLDASAGPSCLEQVGLTGVRASVEHGPLEAGLSPVLAEEVFLALPKLAPCPVRVGERVCGAIHGYSLGYDRGSAAVLYGAQGELLLAFSDALPREASPLPGWTFTLGPERRRELRDEGYEYVTHDVRLAHGGEGWSIRAEAATTIRADGATFAISAAGYRTRGPLPVWIAWLQSAGYGFIVIRDRRKP